MQLYILNNKFLRSEIVESYQSLIWTERYNAWGDFELTIDPRVAEAALMVHGTWLACDKSERVMKIEYIETDVNEDGTRVMTLKGRSLESYLEDRPNTTDWRAASGPAVARAVGTAAPGVIIENLFGGAFISAYSSYPTDCFPVETVRYHSDYQGDYWPTSTVANMMLEPGNMYDTFKNIAEVYNLGFRFIRPNDTLNANGFAKLYFEVYTGRNRTTGQTTYAPVVFSSDLDSLTDTKMVASSAGQKNVAYVWAPNGSRIVYAPGVSSSVSAFDRRVLIVKANDITDAAGTTLQNRLEQRGLEELAIASVQYAMDGVIPDNGPYQYGVHYNLGDLVEQQDDNGNTNFMWVTEQIFISDQNGEKSYPTLSLKEFVTPGSWDSVDGNRTWSYYTTETWSTV